MKKETLPATIRKTNFNRIAMRGLRALYQVPLGFLDIVGGAHPKKRYELKKALSMKDAEHILKKRDFRFVPAVMVGLGMLGIVSGAFSSSFLMAAVGFLVVVVPVASMDWQCYAVKNLNKRVQKNTQKALQKMAQAPKKIELKR